MLLELFPFVILNNVMAFIYAYFFSDFLRFDMSLLLLTVTLRGVSNKHCLLSLFSLSLFSQFELSHFLAQLLLKLMDIRYLVSATPPTILFQSF